MVKKRRKTMRIYEAYCSRGPKMTKNPMGGRKKMRWWGSCVVLDYKTKNGKIKEKGAGRVKVIPVTKAAVKDIAKTWKKNKRSR